METTTAAIKAIGLEDSASAASSSSSSSSTASMAWPTVVSTDFAKQTKNPIRAIVDNMDLSGNPAKKMIPLSIGDPTVFGNLNASDLFVETLVENLRSGKFNGYTHSTGYPAAREALAKHFTEEPESGVSYEAGDVVIASGCSGALDLAINVLAQEGHNILMSCPGFSLYETIAASKGVETRRYNLLAEKSWEVDLEHMDRLIDDNTRAVIVTNPSNPCGSVFSREHIADIVALCERRRVPIIADEVYAHMVFSSQTYVSLASQAKKVPVLSCGGIAKRYLVPGWRLGWILVHDPVGAFTQQVRPGLLALSQLILGANSLVQSALPQVLEQTPKVFFRDVITHLEANAKYCFKALNAIEGLTPVMPQGAMYMMVQVDVSVFEDVENDVDFTQRLLREQSVFCLPATVFGTPNFFRIVTTVPQALMAEAMDRIAEFCQALRIKQ